MFRPLKWYLLCTSFHKTVLHIQILYILKFYIHLYYTLLIVNLTNDVMTFKLQIIFGILIVLLSFFSLPWTWTHEWPKNVGCYREIKYNSDAQVHLLANLKKNIFCLHFLSLRDVSCGDQLLPAVRTAINPVKSQQFIILFSTTCFGLKNLYQLEHKNKGKLCIF